LDVGVFKRLAEVAVGSGGVVSKVAAKLLTDLASVEVQGNLVLALKGFDPCADVVAYPQCVVEDRGGAIVILFALFAWFAKSVVVTEVGN